MRRIACSSLVAVVKLCVDLSICTCIFVYLADGCESVVCDGASECQNNLGSCNSGVCSYTDKLDGASCSAGICLGGQCTGTRDQTNHAILFDHRILPDTRISFLHVNDYTNS